jgi:hypothetical protein
MTPSKSSNSEELLNSIVSLTPKITSVPGWYEKELNTRIKYRRFPKGTRKLKALNESLLLMGNYHLIKNTLLSAGVHKKHCKILQNNYLNRLNKFIKKANKNIPKSKIINQPDVGYYECPSQCLARSLIRFVTVIHSVEALNVATALIKAKELKFEIETYVNKVTGTACLGAIEVEVISIKLAERIRDFNSKNKKYKIDEDGVIDFSVNADADKEYRKYDACKKLGSHLDPEDINGESGQFLIHFHGILFFQEIDDINKLFNILIKNPNWNKAPRQIQFKSLTEVYKGDFKTVKSSLKDIARYITKGGYTMANGEGYSKYNISVPEGLPMTYDEYLTFCDQSNSNKRLLKIEEGYALDIPNLSIDEINSLAQVVDGMMNWNTTKTGYLVRVGRW